MLHLISSGIARIKADIIVARRCDFQKIREILGSSEWKDGCILVLMVRRILRIEKIAKLRSVTGRMHQKRYHKYLANDANARTLGILQQKRSGQPGASRDTADDDTLGFSVYVTSV